MTNPPADLLEYALLRKLSGYTSETLLAEDPDKVERWIICMNQEDAAQRPGGA